MPKYQNIKIYNGMYCLDIDDNFPKECNINDSYPDLLLVNTKKYIDITNFTRIAKAFYFIFPWETNYQHWIIEHLPRYIEYLGDIPILISKDIPNYFKEFLADFCLGSIIYIEKSKNYLVGELHVPDYYNLNFQFKKLKEITIYNRIKDKYRNKNLETGNMYISHTDETMLIDNNIVLDNYFRSIGYKVINIDQLSFKRRVQLYLHNNIITIYNKNLASSVFSEKAVDVILHPNSKCIFFWRIIARQMGFKYSIHKNLFLNNIVLGDKLVENFNKNSGYSFLDKIYVITLRSVKNRVENVEKIVEQNPSIKIFNAIDKNDLMNSNDFLEKYLNDKWINSEFLEKYHGLYGKICCKLSHTHLWWECFSKELPYIIVLEDDIKLSNNFNQVVNDILNELGDKFYFVSLYIHPHYKYNQNKHSKKYPSGKQTVSKMAPQYGNVAYIINYKLCQIIFNDLEKYSGHHNDLITEELCRKYPTMFYATNETIVENLGDISYKDYKANKKNKLKSSIWVDFREDINLFF
jgi:GR25 family glycosyltransferase involved in LPS biosynthesis